jgi:hypothetical protein
VHPYSEQILVNLMSLLSGEKLNKMLAKTLAATLGRASLVMAEQVAMMCG